MFLFPALLLLVLAVIFVFGVRNEPRDVGLHGIEDEPDCSSNAAVESKPTLARRQNSAKVIRDLMTSPAIWAISLMYFFLTVTRYSFLFWLPLLSHKVGALA